MLRLSLVVVSLLVASSVSAQTVERTIDLSALGWGMVNVYPVDTDDNPQTEEWVVAGVDFFAGTSGQWRVVAVRDNGLCVGDWFSPKPATVSGFIALQRINGRDKLIVTLTTFNSMLKVIQTLKVVNLDTPQCQ